MPKVIICDDHAIVSDGLRSLIHTEPGWQVITTTSNGRELLDTLRLVTPDLVLLDVDMPVLNGFETMRLIKEQYPDLKVVILTMHNEQAIVRRFVNLGAKGYLPKDSDRTSFFDCLNKVIAGQTSFSFASSGKMPNALANEIPQEVHVGLLTERETEILKLIAGGFSNKEIADKLGISHRTVDTHRTNLMRKLDLNNTAALVRYAFRNGLI
ncbi:MAG: response regulator transcription factor [Bacteroidetes bacterium]|nr:response regulator transcription factor [Bacteroidota bacterium]